MRSSQPAAEARKAEGASWTALRIPNPPNPTGSIACDQVEAPSKLIVNTALLLQRIAVAMQRGNTAAVLGTMTVPTNDFDNAYTYS